MLICRKNSSDPAARQVHAYRTVSINGTDQLACGIVLKDGTVYSPAGSPVAEHSKVFCVGLWNKPSVIGMGSGLVSSLGSIIMDNRGGYYWHTPNIYEWMKAYGASNNPTKCLVYVNNGSEQSSQWCNYYYNLFNYYSAITPSLELGNMTAWPLDNERCKGMYNDNSNQLKQMCIALGIGNLGSGVQFLLRVNQELNVRILGDDTYTPSNPNFDMKLASAWNTKGTNDTFAWIPNNESYNIVNNSSGYYECTESTSKILSSTDSEGHPVIMLRGSRLFSCMADGSISSIRFAAPALLFGTYSTSGTAPTKQLQVTGFSMTIEGWIHSI